ncbi:alanine:cation symporter family protein, partial [Salmonella enterica subsp. enterica serovar Kentucky]|nr:alanine:cation symporter family protein [Salmonella enterica subsp. enterica serovar Kentucky]
MGVFSDTIIICTASAMIILLAGNHASHSSTEGIQLLQHAMVSNFPARNPEGEQTWSNNDKLSPYTNNIIQVWRSGTGVNKDQEE